MASIFDDLGAHFATLGPPFGVKLAQHGAKNPLKAGKNLQILGSLSAFSRVLGRISFQELPQPLPGTIFDEFGTKVGHIFVILAMLFVPNFAKTVKNLNTKRKGQEPNTNLTRFDKIKQDQPKDRQA